MDVRVTEKSFGPKSLMRDVAFAVSQGEKVGLIGRNGIGKSTLFQMLSGNDTDYSGDIIFRRGTVVVTTAQEFHGTDDMTVLNYILEGIPEYAQLQHIITTYPETMGDDMTMINRYSESLERFTQKGFYQIEEQIVRELEGFQLPTGIETRVFASLSGGQKRLVEVVKIMHAQSQLALIDEPTNHMDYVAKAQFIDWLKAAKEAVLVITHDRDVLHEMDRIIELKDGTVQEFSGNYDVYLKQNTSQTSLAMNDYEMIEKRKTNLKTKIIDYQRLKEKSRNQSTIQRFKRLEQQSRDELAQLETIDKPTFWIDSESADQLDYKAAKRYDSYKAKNIKLDVGSAATRSQRAIARVDGLSLGYDEPLFKDVSFQLRTGEALELRGRNGAGKSTLIKALLGNDEQITTYAGTTELEPQLRIGVYEQEIAETYFRLSLEEAIERIYLDRDLTITTSGVRRLLSQYLFTDADRSIPVERLSGGQKARLQLISMLANTPQLLILDEPTNHLDLPSIEELEKALTRYDGAVIYVSHDGYFRRHMGGEVVTIGVQ